jgi:vancomycin permeability regulator SanA
MRKVWQSVPRWLRIAIPSVVAVALAGVLFAAGAVVWTRVAAGGHMFTEADLTGDGGPRADVTIVLGAQVEHGGTKPMLFLQGRLDTALALLNAGRTRVILASGDGHGSSGNETAVMRSYLSDAGVDPARVVEDPYGLDTYDSCVRARQVYGVTRAIVVTQSYHLPRAVTLCRQAGIDADGVVARCDGCANYQLVSNAMRDYLACTKAVWDVWRRRPPEVTSAPSTAVADAVARFGSVAHR